LTNALTQSAIIYGTFQDLRGQQAPIGDCLSRGFSAMPKVVIGAILASIGLVIGFFLLFVPGVILLLMWWVYIPVIVVEAAGITQSFGRSRALTRGHRWGILGLLVIVGIVQTVAGIIVGALGSLLGTTATEVLNLVVTLGFGAFSSVMAAVGYYRLRAEKEGIVIDDLARVFD
jgi:mannose/fructose/N-acetylgalactosamine-specific phosphotransferase system component IID